MMKFKVDAAKAGFFDSTEVVKAVDKATRKTLSKAGAFIATDAKRSMRPAKQAPTSSLTPKQQKSYKRRMKLFKEGKTTVKPKRPLVASKPGEPPRTRFGYIKKFLYFAFDPQTKSVVVGPALLNKTTMAQATLEEGGTTVVKALRFVTRDGQVTTETTTRTITIDPRPYMQPAYSRNEEKVAEMFRNSVNK